MPVRGPCPELDLGHKFGAHEAHLPRLRGGELVLEGRRLVANALKLRLQGLRHLDGEAGADAPAIAQLAVLVLAEHQRSDGLLRYGGRHIATDDEFLPR